MEVDLKSFQLDEVGCRPTIQGEGDRKVLKHVPLLALIQFLHVVEEAMLLSDLVVKFEMIDHLLDTMDTQVIKSNTL